MRTLHKNALVALAACISSTLSAGTISTPLSVTIATQNFYGMFILCTVPIGSCNANSPTPLIRVEFDSPSLPPFSQPDVINNVNTGIVQSGYITFIAQDQSSPADVVIGMRNGLVNVGDPWPFSTPESLLAADLLVGDAAAIADFRNFFLSNLTSFPQVGGTAGTMYRFSNATVVGTIGPSVIISDVPEPASWALTVLTLGAMAALYYCSKASHS